MQLSELHRKFPTDAKCRAYLEKLRWNGKPICPYCKSDKVSKIKSEDRYNCVSCKRNFSVTVGTIFEGSHYELTNWFTLLALMLNAKKGISAMELMRNLGCSYKTAWFCAMRIRCAMIDNCIELENIVEMDEAYVGGKPRKVQKNKGENQPNIGTITFKRGRGTKKTPIVGVVERKGKIVLKVVESINASTLRNILKDNVNLKNTIVMTDELPTYNSFDKLVQHLSINHSAGKFSEGIVNTNTIEGFWSIVKNSIRGQYIALSKKYLPLYLVQAQFIYNRRDSSNDVFEEYMKLALADTSCMIKYKPKKDVKSIVYPPKSKVKC